MPHQAKQRLLHSSAGKRPLRFESLEDRRVLAALALDAEFGEEGIVRFASVRDRGEDGTSESGKAIVALPDGKLLVGGTTLSGHGLSLAFARFLSDGTPDMSFGDQGSINPVLGAEALWLEDLALLPGGDLLATADAGNSKYLIRFQADGALDTSFGDQGVLSTTSLGLTVSDVDVQSTGRIILTAADLSGFLIAGLTPNGSLDPTFGGGDGRVEDASFYPHGTQTVVQSGDQIVVTGQPKDWEAPYDIQVARWSPDGSADVTFAGDGLQTVDWEYEDPFGLSSTLATLAGDKIVLAAKTGDGEISVVRLLAGGGFDASFGGAGFSSVSLGPSEGDTVQFTSLTVDGSGGVVLASTLSTAEDYQLALARLTADGGVDAAFGTGGVQSEALSYWGGNVGGVTVSGDRIVVGVDVAVSPRPESRMGILQFEADGDLDLAFGDAGQASIVVSEDLLAENPDDAVVQADGKILVASRYDIDHRLYRFHEDGGLDTTFGGDGQVDLPDFGVHGVTLALQADGKILVGGWAFETVVTSSIDATLTRLLPDGSLDPSFGDNGTLRFDNPGTTEETKQIAALPDGSIAVVFLAQGDYKVQLVQPSGSVAPSFGGGQPVELQKNLDGSFDFVDMTVLASGGVQFVLNNLDFGDFVNRVTLATMLPNGTWDPNFGEGGWATIDNLSREFSAWAVDWQDDGSALLGGFGSAFDTAVSAVVRVHPSGSVDTTFGDGGLAVVESNSSIRALHALDDGRILLVEEKWNGDDTDVAIEALRADGTLDTDFGGGSKTLEVGVYNDLIRKTIPLSATRLLLVGTVQTEDASPLFLANVVLPESAWQNPSEPLNVDGDPEGTIVPLDALLIINTLNLDGPRLLTGGPDGDQPRYYDVSGDGWVTAIDALMVINWLNANPIGGSGASPLSSGEGEGPTGEENDASPLAEDPLSASSDAHLDAAAVAWLMSSFETKEKRR